MAKDIQRIKIVRGDYKYRRNANGTKVESGVFMPRIAVGIFDTAGLDSSLVSNKTIAAHGMGVYIPKGGIVVAAWYEVVTTFTSSGSNAGTIALSLVGAGDCVTAIAISDASTPWTAGLHGCKPGNPAEATVAGDTQILAAARAAATWIGPVTAEKELVATVAVDALTAGKLIFYVEFVQGI
jgi:hypothetical protein